MPHPRYAPGTASEVVTREELRSKLRYYGRKERLLPGMKRVERLHPIPVQPVPKSRVKKQYTNSDGTKTTILKQAKGI